MPARFARLRITGFKSFADATSIEILPGLTGIVGPNGCGKSNIVDALRWAMGESSAKSMRGGEMDDVIFAGTLSRPARSIAEVSISLTETAGLAPAPFQAEAELEISRRIERGSGSTYRVNRRETRARDVATLLADLAAGARNSAMISQGRVSALVSARPDERRMILEEAAGISGLHARRHEAELKLRATEDNLSRADDLRTQQETHLTALRAQAAQAHRYRVLSTEIRNAEAEYLTTERLIAEQRRQQARRDLEAAKAAVIEAQARKDAALAAEIARNDDVPALRLRESEARTALERTRIHFEQIETEIARVQSLRIESQRRLESLLRDQDHAERARADAEAAQTRLEREEQHLTALENATPQQIDSARAAAASASAALERAEAQVQTATDAAAHFAASRQAVTSRLALTREKAAQAKLRANQAAEAHRRAQSELVAPEQLARAAAERERAETVLLAAEQALDLCQTILDAAELTRAKAAEAATAARAGAIAADASLATVRIEAEALTKLLARKFSEENDPVLDRIKVPPGYETALGAAMQNELAVGTRAEAARRWRQLPPIESQHCFEPLSTVIQGPPELARALDHILLLPDGDDGNAQQSRLAPGETLVSKQGEVWRWDGFTARSGAPGEAGMRLAQRNRLAALQDDLTTATAHAAACRTGLRDTEAAESAARRAEDEARRQRKTTEAEIDRARNAKRTLTEAAAHLDAQAERQATRAAGAAEANARFAAEYTEIAQQLADVQAESDALGDPRDTAAALDTARHAMQEARRAEAASRKQLDQLVTEAEQRKRRLELVGRERADWQERSRDIAFRLTDLAARITEAKAALAALPDDLLSGQARDAARAATEEAQSAHRTAKTDLANAERDHQLSTAAAREAEQAVATTREALIAAESSLREADFAWGSIAERMLERLGVAPVLPSIENPTQQNADRARRRFERLTREREEIGPVNLRADMEVSEIETRLAAIESERAELSTAIAKLRGSIGNLNHEGRERLSAVFTEIDRHFQSLFSRMFGGGRAHLALTGSDDPLQAGLEIFAEPPGKKLATLSLLSGGEQALTALSLIFAVFRCNPAPFSVLDEVDAPLDDANVDRFCTLLDDMSRETGTRFLVVTHHHHTMARMDRLYGVTMQERGISRILSVDLGTAASFAERPEALAAE
ncbi:chromosome segregation protein SMC [Acidiphilium acidophilum]|uniref:Chromosome partition protein Smc n=1 Tax=Acidiphilium acidophilum TaxID=76588 RepID=A0AAW9DQA9_ACIAO|nr:chromosome segregation protein SMC [Acidiphilium acidophilum]MDX5930826.1 chromosome segregation protein SMC [Acidiphilium acidophilum]